MLSINNVQSWNVWASTHFAGAESIDADTIITEERIKINPNPGIGNAWAFEHDKLKLDSKWPVPPNLVYEVDDYRQVSVWYTVRPIKDSALFTPGGDLTKSGNTFWMMMACLRWNLGGVELDEITNPAHIEGAEFSTQLDEMGEMKKLLKAQDRWHHTLHERIGGGMSTSPLKVKASSENFAKAREAARIKHAETADKKARQLLVILDAGGSYEDISSIYNCSMDAARMAVSRARRRLGVEIPTEEAPKPVQAAVAPSAAPVEMPTLPPKPSKPQADDEMVDLIRTLA